MAEDRVSRANRPLLAALTAGALVASALPAEAQYIPGLGYAQRYLGDVQRQQNQAQRRLYQEQQQAVARERAPHEASAQYTGQLTPVTDLNRLVSGKTFYMERPIVADGQIQSMKTNETFFAADGNSYSVAWSGRHWMTGEIKSASIRSNLKAAGECFRMVLGNSTSCRRPT